MDILLRNIPKQHVDRLDAEAERRGISRQALLTQIVADWAAPPAVVGWFQAEHPTSGTCVQCGAQTERPWFVILSDGKLNGPFCARCAQAPAQASSR